MLVTKLETAVPFFLMHLMNVSISVFTISYCYRAQQTEAFSEEKTMQQL